MDFKEEEEKVNRLNYKLSDIKKSKSLMAKRLMEYYRNNFGI